MTVDVLGRDAEQHGLDTWEKLTDFASRDANEAFFAGLGPGGGFFTLPNTILHEASEEMKKEFLPKIFNNEGQWSITYTEPSAGTDIGNLQTRAVDKGGMSSMGKAEKSYVPADGKNGMDAKDSKSGMAGGVTLFLILKAFSSGSTALTGVEAVSNGVPGLTSRIAQGGRAGAGLRTVGGRGGHGRGSLRNI